MQAEESGAAWMRHMRAGEFELAWRLSDEVLRQRQNEDCRHLPRHFQWLWRGQSLAGRHVVIRCFHGLGDTIQFIRYAAPVRQIAARVTVCAQAELLPLLARAEGIDRLLPLSENEIACEVEVESMELPHILRSTLTTLPNQVPYLHVTPAELPNDHKLQVGLVWAGGDWVPERSVPAEVIEELGDVNGVTFHILQRGAELARWRGRFGLDSGSDDVLTAARTIAALDLMITIDSMPAHLAGALGVQTWTLLPAVADWRWMTGRDDSPWYPTMRLFRQEAPGDWAAVVRRVRDQLQQLVRASAD